jgi:sugar phosphate isomerase/epimerase
MSISIPRRRFLVQTSAALGTAWLPHRALAQDEPDAACRFGLVTYLWGKDVALHELIAACARSGVLGVELRTTHRHGVEPSLSAAQRSEVRKRFADSPVTLVGLGSNERFDSPDPATVQAAIKTAKEFIQLSHDVGSSGVKVKGDQFHAEIPRQTTLNQVIAALRELGNFADQLDQEVRLEVHGGFSDVSVHHQIISGVNHPRVRTCWNSNRQDLEGPGLRANFDLVKNYFGRTAHVRQLDDPDYPWGELMGMFVGHGYDGWILLEAHGEVAPNELASRLTEQRRLFDHLVAESARHSAG